MEDASPSLPTNSSSVSLTQSTAWVEKTPSPPRSPIQSMENYNLIESAESRSPISTDALNPEPSHTVQKPASCKDWIKANIRAVYDSILFPLDFLIFNVICILQTVPALTYYIFFFQRDYSLPASSGMPPVWGCTIGTSASMVGLARRSTVGLTLSLFRCDFFCHSWISAHARSSSRDHSKCLHGHNYMGVCYLHFNCRCCDWSWTTTSPWHSWSSLVWSVLFVDADL